MSDSKSWSRVRLPRGAMQHLKADAAMEKLIVRVGRFHMLRRSRTELEALVRSIIGQQLSGLAADAIHARFRAVFAAPQFPSASEILSVDPEILRKAGLSRQKLGAILDLCRRIEDGQLFSSRWQRLDDEALIEHLSSVRGIGRWSAQMFLMFHCGRSNVWPEDDLGIRKAVARLRGWTGLPTRAQTRREGELFAPFCTVAAWYLWRSLDGQAQMG